MPIIDLTHIIAPGMPVYPGTAGPVFKTGCSLEEDGFLEKEITFFSHTGTHIDAPAHLLEHGRPLDGFPADHFYGPALLVDVSDLVGDSIPVERFSRFEAELAAIDFVLIRSGWSRYWGSDAYFCSYPVLSAEAATWLAGQKLKGIGFDAISADPAGSVDFAIHKILLNNDMVIIENLKDLEAIGSERFNFSCFPLHIEEADGSPVRAVAYLEPAR